MSQRHPHVVNLKAVEADEIDTPQGFKRSRRMLGRAAGGRDLGTSYLEVPPGASAWPRHAHFANEEALFILEGQGELRLGDDRVSVGAHDYVALPADPDLPHQLVNTGHHTLKYLCISTMRSPEVGVYPDSGKIGVIAGSAPGGPPENRRMTAFFRTGDDVPYYDGERSPPLDDEGAA